jgi:hypothetical protein
MNREVDISDLVKETTNTISIKMPDGKVFEISRIITLVNNLYSKMVDDATNVSKTLIKVNSLVEQLNNIDHEDKEAVQKAEAIAEKVEDLKTKSKGSDESFMRRQLKVIEAILKTNSSDFVKKDWVENYTLGERSAFIKAALEKDIDPKKKTGSLVNQEAKR